MRGCNDRTLVNVAASLLVTPVFLSAAVLCAAIVYTFALMRVFARLPRRRDIVVEA